MNYTNAITQFIEIKVKGLSIIERIYFASYLVFWTSLVGSFIDYEKYRDAIEIYKKYREHREVIEQTTENYREIVERNK